MRHFDVVFTVSRRMVVFGVPHIACAPIANFTSMAFSWFFVFVSDAKVYDTQEDSDNDDDDGWHAPTGNIRNNQICSNRSQSSTLKHNGHSRVESKSWTLQVVGLVLLLLQPAQRRVRFAVIQLAVVFEFFTLQRRIPSMSRCLDTWNLTTRSPRF